MCLTEGKGNCGIENVTYEIVYGKGDCEYVYKEKVVEMRSVEVELITSICLVWRNLLQVNELL